MNRPRTKTVALFLWAVLAGTVYAQVGIPTGSNFSGGTLSSSLTIPVGTAAAPSINFTGETNTGIFQRASGFGIIDFTSLGVGTFEIATNAATMVGTGQFNWNSGAMGTGTDTGFARASAGVVKVTNGGAGGGGILLGLGSPGLQFEDANGYISRTVGSNTMSFAPSLATVTLSLTGALATVGGAASSYGISGLSASAATGLFTIQSSDKGGNTGVGHAILLAGGAGSTLTTGTAGGNASVRGGAAGGSAANVGGDVLLDGGTPTSTAGTGRVLIGSVNTGTWLQQSAGYLALNADYTNATASFTNTNLSATVISGRTYMIEAAIFLVDSTAADGAKIDFNGGTAAATNFRMHCILDDTTTTIDQSTQITALATALSQASLTGASLWKCHGSFVPSGNGTLILRGGQVTHTTGTVTINRGSYLRIDDAKPL